MGLDHEKFNFQVCKDSYDTTSVCTHLELFHISKYNYKEGELSCVREKNPPLIGLKWGTLTDIKLTNSEF